MSILVKEVFGWSLSVGRTDRDGELGEDVPERERSSAKGWRCSNDVCPGNGQSF